MPKAIICDIDSTLANIDHRLHLLPDFDAFFSRMAEDTPNEWCLDLLDAWNGQRPRPALLIVTGRPEKHRAATERWLASHHVRHDQLFMRPDFLPGGKPDHREDDVVKQEIYDREIRDKFSVSFVVEDRKKVVQMWRRIGLTCLQCAEGDY